MATQKWFWYIKFTEEKDLLYFVTCCPLKLLLHWIRRILTVVVVYIYYTNILKNFYVVTLLFDIDCRKIWFSSTFERSQGERDWMVRFLFVYVTSHAPTCDTKIDEGTISFRDNIFVHFVRFPSLNYSLKCYFLTLIFGRKEPVGTTIG